MSGFTSPREREASIALGEVHDLEPARKLAWQIRKRALDLDAVELFVLLGRHRRVEVVRERIGGELVSALVRRPEQVLDRVRDECEAAGACGSAVGLAVDGGKRGRTVR